MCEGGVHKTLRLEATAILEQAGYNPVMHNQELNIIAGPFRIEVQTDTRKANLLNDLNDRPNIFLTTKQMQDPLKNALRKIFEKVGRPMRIPVFTLQEFRNYVYAYRGKRNLFVKNGKKIIEIRSVSPQ